MHRVVSAESIQAPSGHPARYTPENVHVVGLSFLHSQFKFEQVLEVNTSESRPVQGFQFARADNRHVNYFMTVKDAKSEPREFPYPTIDEWIESYKALIRNGDLIPQDISIMPLVQVREGRKHFNTLCIYADENTRLHILLIEPREDNRMIIRNYPVQDILAKLRTGFADVGVEVIVENLMIGTQSKLDDTTCGAQHINALEVLSQLNTPVLENHQQVKKYIATAVISRRDADNRVIHVYNTLTKDTAKQIGQPELDKELLGVEEPKEKGREHSKVDEADNDGFISSNHNNDEIYMEPSQLRMSRQINLRINETLRQRTRANDQQRLGQALAAVQKYALVNRNVLGFFTAHTRHQTAGAIINILETIQQEDNLSIDQRNYKAAMFLYHCYRSMSNESGILQSHIEQALVKLLDCGLEFNHISGYARNERCFPLTQLFANRLRLMGMNIPNMGIQFEVIRDHMRAISSSDSSLKAKFSQNERQRIDTSRAARFAQIRAELFKPAAQARYLRMD